MFWKDIKLWKKIMLGIGAVIMLMVVISGWSWMGINGIVNDATELSTGNKLVGVLLQREIDHLNWAGEVNKLLNDKAVTQLNVQTDHTQCGFGKWYYGSGRLEAETVLPALKNPMNAIEDPHKRLHQSAVKIKELFKDADAELPAILANKEADHLSWSEKIQSAILGKKGDVGVQLDHTLCAFGKLLYGETGKKMGDADPSLAALLEKIKAPHQRLHQSGEKINQALKTGDFNKAYQIYAAETSPLLASTREGLHKLQARASQNLEGANMARAVYASETQPNLKKVQGLLMEMSQITRKNVISEDQMLEKAVTTRLVVVIISILALVVGILLAIFISRAITNPVKSVMTLMVDLKNGTFNTRSNINQKDEIGLMAKTMDECGDELQNAVDNISFVMNGVKNGDL
ncbi:MAG: HAMP domain-containing protein, partial [Deltaproteobacteria bacterium]|nr:HAMP domain-containing protein [Deltaproteobacteria bacterium]